MTRTFLLSMCSILLLAGCSGGSSEHRATPRGATVPWEEYEAEAGASLGQARLEETTTGPWLEGTLSGEASGRKAVTLHGPADAVRWTSRAEANSVVVRYSVPDDTSALLDVFVNGGAEPVAQLTVNADFSWIYTGPTNTETHTALPHPESLEAPLPMTDPHHLYDEASALLSADGSATIHRGDAVEVRPHDASQPITIDFMDLELVAAPLAAPAGYVPVAELTQAGVEAALQAAVDGDRPGIFLPAGTYVMTGKVHVPAGKTVQGAGMWHTRLVPPEGQLNHDFGFKLDGNDIAFQDFSIFGTYRNRTIRYDAAVAEAGGWPWPSYDGIGRAFDGYMHENAVFQRLWVERMIVGGWVEGGNNLLWKDCRFRNTMADGINLCNGTTNSRIVNCTARNNGDDAFAMWSAITWDKAPVPETPWVHQPEGPDQGNVIERCTAGLIWRAAGFAVYGGHDNVIKDSVVYDTLLYPGITVDQEFAPQHEFSGITTIRNMTVERCGGRMWWDDDGPQGDPAQRRRWGAVWLFAANPYPPIRFQGIRLKDIDIIDPVYSGVLAQTIQQQSIEDTVLDHIRIVMNRSGDYGMVATDSHKAPPASSGYTGPVGTSGSVTIRNSSITGSRVTSGNLFFKDEVSTGTFTFEDGGGNDWTGDR